MRGMRECDSELTRPAIYQSLSCSPGLVVRPHTICLSPRTRIRALLRRVLAQSPVITIPDLRRRSRTSASSAVLATLGPSTLPWAPPCERTVISLRQTTTYNPFQHDHSQG